MSWQYALAFTCAGLAIVCVAICLCGSRKRNPVIKAKPRPDSRIYSVGKDVK